MGWAGIVARMGEMRMHTRFWLVNLKVRGHLEDPGVYRAFGVAFLVFFGPLKRIPRVRFLPDPPTIIINVLHLIRHHIN
jgi:hypothetical protein